MTWLMTRTAVPVLVVAAAVFVVAVSGAAVVILPRGVSPADAHRYAAVDGAIECGGQVIPGARVNDDYCDCPDGADEPGTSACPNGRFYCQNKLHRAEVVPASRVNDGVCDCCDGSDEWAGVVTCPHTCRELGLATRTRNRERFAMVQRGLAARKEAAAKAAAELDAKRAELANLKKVLAEQEAEEKRLEPLRDAAQAAETAKQDEVTAKKEKEAAEIAKKAEDSHPEGEQQQQQHPVPVMEPMPTMQEAQKAVGFEHAKFEHMHGGVPEPREDAVASEGPEKPTEESGQAAATPPSLEEPPKPEEPVDPELVALKEGLPNTCWALTYPPPPLSLPRSCQHWTLLPRLYVVQKTTNPMKKIILTSRRWAR
jgi:protein kinase C substrate 80K-H